MMPMAFWAPFTSLMSMDWTVSMDELTAASSTMVLVVPLRVNPPREVKRTSPVTRVESLVFSVKDMLLTTLSS
ncbi:hypothetical protein D9M70_500340 [compost metagenome]